MRNDSPQAALAPAMVMLAATLASGLVWLTVAAEDAPELLASAPVDRGLLRRAKLVAGARAGVALTLPLALVLARRDPLAAAIFTACFIGATLSAGASTSSCRAPGGGATCAGVARAICSPACSRSRRRWPGRRDLVPARGSALRAAAGVAAVAPPLLSPGRSAAAAREFDAA